MAGFNAGGQVGFLGAVLNGGGSGSGIQRIDQAPPGRVGIVNNVGPVTQLYLQSPQNIIAVDAVIPSDPGTSKYLNVIDTSRGPRAIQVNALFENPLIILRYGPNPAVITDFGGGNIDGQPSYTLAGDGDWVEIIPFVGAGITWSIINKGTRIGPVITGSTGQGILVSNDGGATFSNGPLAGKLLFAAKSDSIVHVVASGVVGQNSPQSIQPLFLLDTATAGGPITATLGPIAFADGGLPFTFYNTGPFPAYLAPDSTELFDGVNRLAIMPGQGFTLTADAAGNNWRSMAIDAPGAALPAGWRADKVGYFFVDYDGGSDSNFGFIEGNPGDTFTGVDIAAAGGAKKTIEAAMAALPRDGNGRQFVMLIKRRAGGDKRYFKPDGITVDSPDVSVFSNYSKNCVVRASTDLSNDAADKLSLGAQIAIAGPNGDGSFTATGGTSKTITGAGFPAEAAQYGTRIRFITGALAGTSLGQQMLNKGTATVITTATSMFPSPAAGDTFLIEKPGVEVLDINLSMGGNRASSFSTFGFSASALNSISCVGFGLTSTANENFNCGSGCGMQAEISFCTHVNAAAVYGLFGYGGGDGPRIRNKWTDETRTYIQSGLGYGGDQAVYFAGLDSLMFRDFHLPSTALQSQLENIRGLMLGMGSVIGYGMLVTNCGVSPDGTFLTQFSQIGSNSGESKMRQVSGGVWVVSGNLRLQYIDAGASLITQLFSLSGTGNTYYMDGLVGTVTNDRAIGLACRDCKIYVGLSSACTIAATGAPSAFMLMQPNAYVPVATFTKTNVVDTFGNNAIGTGGNIVSGPSVEIRVAGGAASVLGNLIAPDPGNFPAGNLLQADTEPHASGAVLVMLHDNPGGGFNGLAVPLGGGCAPFCLFDAAPTYGDLSYVSLTAGKATSTVIPAVLTNQKRRLGHVIAVSGSLGRIAGSPELLPILSDGVAP